MGITEGTALGAQGSAHRAGPGSEVHQAAEGKCGQQLCQAEGPALAYRFEGDRGGCGWAGYAQMGTRELSLWQSD